MDTKTSSLQEQPEKDKRRRILLFVIWLLLLISIVGNGVLFWLFSKERKRAQTVIKEKEIVMVEKDHTKDDLLKLQEDFSMIKTNNKKINAELEQKRAEIADLIKEADKHQGDAWYISKLQKQTEGLKNIMKGYIRAIDSLNTSNKFLLKENVKVRTQYLSEKEKTSNLIKEKEDLQVSLNKGGLLKSSGTVAKGVIVRRGGKKESDTKKAKKVDKIKVTTTIIANELAKKGDKDIYMRVVTPDGRELARAIDDANSFAFNGVRGFFCAKETITYENQEMPITLYAVNKAGFLPGKYIIELYCDENLMGQTTLVLE